MYDIEAEIDEETYSAHSTLKVNSVSIEERSVYVLYMRNPDGDPFAERWLMEVNRVHREPNGDLLVDACIVNLELEGLKVVDCIFNSDGFLFLRDEEEELLIGFLWPCESLGISEQVVKDAVSEQISQNSSTSRLTDPEAILAELTQLFGNEAPNDQSPDRVKVNFAITGAVTANLLGDNEAMKEVLKELNHIELSMFMGGLIATCSNMIKVLAASWDCEPIEAWRIIQRARHELGLS